MSANLNKGLFLNSPREQINIFVLLVLILQFLI